MLAIGMFLFACNKDEGNEKSVSPFLSLGGSKRVFSLSILC